MGGHSLPPLIQIRINVYENLAALAALQIDYAPERKSYLMQWKAT